MSLQHVPYRPFGALRLVLAVAVVAGHAAWMLDDSVLKHAIQQLRPGAAAVMAFFALSGFILSEAADTFYRGRPVAFLRNRAMKILPAFLGALVLSIVVHLIGALTGRLPVALQFEGYTELPSGMFGAPNIFYNLLSFLPQTVTDPLRRLLGGDDLYLFVRYVWAIKVEMTFYLLLFLVIARRSQFLSLPYVVSIMAFVVAILLFVVNLFYGFSYELRYAAYFAIGILFYRWLKRGGIWGLILALILASLHAFVFFNHLLAPVIVFLVFLLVASLLVPLRVPGPAARLDKGLGDLSYALYLNHYAVLVAFSAFGRHLHLGIYGWGVAVIASVGIAFLMHQLVERPLVRWRDAVRGRSLVKPVSA